jgi:DNA transformation protein and related proteins
MTRRTEFRDHVIETLRAFGPVETKAMFGGHGLYHRGTFFALIAYDLLHVKVDDETRPRFEALGLEPFRFAKKSGEVVSLSYYQVPPEALESPAEMAEWARLGYGAALRSAARKAPASRSTPAKRSRKSDAHR